MNQSKYLFGFFFLTLGCLLLADNFSPFFEFDEFWRLWPLILLLLGVSSLITKDSIKRILMSGIGIVSGIIIFGGMHEDEANIVHFENDEQVSELRDSVSVPFNPALSDTSFVSITAGAASINISTTNDSSLILVQRNSEIYKNNEVNGGNIDESNFESSFSIDHTINNGINKVNLEFGGNLTLFGNRKLKSANVLLSPKAFWNIDIDGGASSLNADLSALRIGTVNLEVGASSITLKLGAIQDSSYYNIEGGAAKFMIEIPEGIGCKIEHESALTRHEFPGFIQKSDLSYETPNYQTSIKKITISLQTGMSSIAVKTYKQIPPFSPTIPNNERSDTLPQKQDIKPNKQSRHM